MHPYAQVEGDAALSDDPLNDCRIIIIRRGEYMRVMYPMTTYGLETTSAPELALGAISLLMQMQAQMPGRADMPITSKTGQMGLALPMHDDVLSDDEPLWVLLAGEWQRYDTLIVDEGTDQPIQRLPAVVLNLIDLNR